MGEHRYPRGKGRLSMGLLKNPFFLRELWVWQRQTRRGSLMQILYSHLAAALVFYGVLACVVAPLAWKKAIDLQFLWYEFAGLWLCMLSLTSIVRASCVYSKERDLDTLPVVVLTAYSPKAEVWGRWLGALLPVMEGWVLCLPLALFAPVCLKISWVRAICLWPFAGLFLGVLVAIGLQFSVACSTVLSVLGSTVTLLVAYVALSALADKDGLPWLLMMPPLPTSFGAFLGTPVDSKILFLVLVPCWITFLFLALCNVARGARKLAHNVYPSTTHGSGRFKALAAPLLSFRLRVVDWLCFRWRDNTYYQAIKRSIARTHASRLVAPASALPALLIICCVANYTFIRLSGHSLIFQLDSGWLPLTIATCCLATFLEGIVHGQRALTSEGEHGTWPLLLGTGMSAERVLAGKFTATFLALSGQWTVTLPFWLMASLLTKSPALSLLALIHPASIAIGIVVGMESATYAQPWEFLANKFPHAYFLVLFFFVFDTFCCPRPFVDSVAFLRDMSVEGLAASFTDMLIHALLLFLLSSIRWHAAVKRLSMVMRGA